MLLCRHWLKQLHTFVLGLQKDVDYIIMAQPVSDQQAHVWHRLLEHAHGKLQCLVGHGGADTGKAQQQQKQQPHEQQQQQQAPVAASPATQVSSGGVPEDGTVRKRVGTCVERPSVRWACVAALHRRWTPAADGSGPCRPAWPVLMHAASSARLSLACCPRPYYCLSWHTACVQVAQLKDAHT